MILPVDILGQYYNEIVPRDIWKTKSAVAMGVNAYSFTLYPTTDTYATNVWDFGELKHILTATYDQRYVEDQRV
jgi:hypothetical protein